MPSPIASVEPWPSRRGVLFGAAATLAAPIPLGIVEPKMRLVRRAGEAPTVAITLDACPGGFDPRVAEALVQARVPATIFVSAPWMRRNPEALAFFLNHPDIFSLENHGAHHLACILATRGVWGLTPAGTLDQVRAEVEDGARALLQASGKRPTWFRGGGAIYSPLALDAIRSLGVGVAAFSLNGDGGATLSATQAAAKIGAARDGDVVIAHINQPHRASGAGVAEGIVALKRRGLRFVRLDALMPRDVVYVQAV